MSVSVALQSTPVNFTESCFRVSDKSYNEDENEGESELLKSLRNVFAPNQSSTTAIRRVLGPSPIPDEGEEGLSWDGRTVVWTIGGIPRRKWDFSHEGQDIQWACWAWFRPDDLTPHTSHNPATRSDDNPTFGPFFQFLQRQRMTAPQDEQAPQSSTACRALVVFLRDIAKVLLRTGIEHTVNLPFLVRRAWDIAPTGLLVQRAQDREEVNEASLLGTPLLPTLFSLSSPLDEFKIVGCARSILGGFSNADTNPIIEPLPSARLHPSDTVLFVSGNSDAETERLLVSHNHQKRRLTIWRYALRKPVASLHASDTDRAAKTRERVLNDRLDRIPLDSEDSPMPAPYTAANLSMPHLPPMSRGDLSSTMDRIHIGGHEVDEGAGGVGDSSMRPRVWLQHVMHMDLTDYDSHHATQITIHPFDTRGDSSTVAVLLPSHTLHLLSLTRQHSSVASSHLASLPARAATSLVVTRAGIKDLVIITPDGSVKVILWDLRELDITLVAPGGAQAHHNLYDHSISFAYSRSNSPTSMQLASPTISRSILSPSQSIIDLNPLSRKPVGFEDPVNSSLTIAFDDGTRARASFDLTPKDWVVRLGFDAFARVVPKEEGWVARKRWLERRGKSERTEFECFSDAVCETFIGSGQVVQSEEGVVGSAWETLSQSRTHTRIRDEQMFTAIGLALPEPDPRTFPLSKPAVVVPSMTSPHLAPAMLALHLAAQTLAADVTKMDRLADMGGLILRLARRVRADYVDYWSRVCCDDGEAWTACVGNEPYLHDERIFAPPDILSHLYTLLAVPHGRTSFPRLSELARKFELSPALEYGRRDPMSRIHLWNDVFTVLCDAAIGDQRARAVGAVSALMAAGDEEGEGRGQKTECERASGIAEAITRLPIGIGAPIREALRSCQLGPPFEMTAGAYTLIGRRDLAHMQSGKASGFTFGGTYEHRARMDATIDVRATADELEREAKVVAQGHTWEHSGTELGLKGFTDVRFGNDQRLREVEQMLSASRVVVIKLKERPELSEHDQAAENQQITHCIAERTFSLAFGRGAYTFGSVPTVMTDVYTIPKIELSVKIYPQNVTVAPEANRIPPDCFQFANFHNGVAAALRISPSSGSVDSSWIAFNRPNDLTAEHAGFLYGLGLTGHLRSMVTWHTFRYLTPKHELTSMGVLLGLAAAHMGTADKATTKLLCVHIPALLPPRAAELNIPHATQIAALSGVGLLYLGTRDRRMAEVMLGEIGKSDGQDAEAYAVSAALSFGMVMLGMGARATSPVDMEILAQLRVLIQGEPARSGASAAPGEKPSFDVNVTSPAATMALALMYLRTGRTDIADLLELPDTAMALYRIQPNLLLVRTLGRALIMWDEIKPSLDWVQDRLPTMGNEQRSDRSLNESVDLAHYHIIAGACFAIGLKYAGTTDEKAYGVIAYWFDFFTKHVTQATVTYEGQVKRSAMRETLNILALALAMVMAGTGELTTLRRLRVAYGRFGPGFKFGSPMCTSLSLGLLFLGGGRYTLSSSNASVACLVAAFYPRLPLTSADNRGHLQLLRHLWVLATEPRCLVARDADTGETVYLPVKVKVAADPPVLHHLMTPTLIPDVRALQSIRVDSPRYWPYYVDVAGVRAHRENILHHQTLFVKRRTGFLSYMEDPRGVRSIFVRAGAHASEPSALDFPASAGLKGAGAQKDLHRFIVSFSNEPMFVAWADRLCRMPENPTRADAARRTYFHQALLECLTADKAQALPLHAGLHALTQTGVDLHFPHPNSSHPNHPFETPRLPLAGHHTTPGPRTLVFRDVRLARDFYAQLFPNFGGRVGEKARGGLVKGSLLSAVAGAWDGVLREAKGGHVQDYIPDVDLGYVGVSAPDLHAAIMRYCLGEDIRPRTPRRSGWMQRERELLRAVGFYLSRFCFPSPDALRGIRVLVEEERANMMKEKRMSKPTTETDKMNAIATRERMLMLLAENAATGLHGYMPIQDEYHPRWTEDCWEAWGWIPFNLFAS
ncbi:Anaphase-promoting complex subunit 1 [Ceratobasidium sp. 392]|nr:Anaphase-promoting complex subunit 1 [Ceratobasidium sp. 392]